MLKLVVNKFEPGTEVQSLEIRVYNEDDIYASRTEYGPWLSGQTTLRRRKCGSLTVKVQNGNIDSDMNLDLCAQPSDNGNFVHSASLNRTAITCIGDEISPMNINGSPTDGAIATDVQNLLEGASAQIDPPISKRKIDLISEILTKKLTFSSGDADLTQDMLEHSLKRVTKINAQIIKNIHLLSRTLCYTKLLGINYRESGNLPPGRRFRRPVGACDYERVLRCPILKGGTSGVLPSSWESIWECPECSQVWPHQSQMLMHFSECSSSGRDPGEVAEIKATCLLKCEFCERMFTNIPCLLHHTRHHDTSHNYSCSLCHLAFSGYRTALSHWRTCPRVRAGNSFSLQKVLLCNVCDHKYQTYDKLYSHRYKECHFLLKHHRTMICNKDTEDTMDVVRGAEDPEVLAYQCENCAHTCATVACLLAHKELHQTDANKCSRLYHLQDSNKLLQLYLNMLSC